MINSIYVTDFDGVLCSSVHRYKLTQTAKGEKPRIDLPHWRRNSTPAMIERDTPIAYQIARYNAAVACKNTLVVIATARIFCRASLNWCIRHLDGMPDYISSRQGENDHRPSNDLKGEFVKRLLLEQPHIIKIVTFTDDNTAYLRAFKASIPRATVIYQPSNQGH